MNFLRLISNELVEFQVNLFKCNIGLDSNHYSAIVECLQDYYAEVRLAACEALFLLGIYAPDRYVFCQMIGLMHE